MSKNDDRYAGWWLGFELDWENYQEQQCGGSIHTTKFLLEVFHLSWIREYRWHKLEPRPPVRIGECPIKQNKAWKGGSSLPSRTYLKIGRQSECKWLANWSERSGFWLWRGGRETVSFCAAEYGRNHGMTNDFEPESLNWQLVRVPQQPSTKRSNRQTNRRPML